MPEYEEKGNFTMLGNFQVNTWRYGEFNLTYPITTQKNTHLTRGLNYGQKDKIIN